MDRYSQSAHKKPVSKGIKRYLVIYGANHSNDHFFYLYDNNNELVYRQISRAAADFFVPDQIAIKATSELKEGNIIYSARNMVNVFALREREAVMILTIGDIMAYCFPMDFDVEDTPQIQCFGFNGKIRRMQIEILEVYNGTKYNDTCINNIFPIESYF